MAIPIGSKVILLRCEDHGFSYMPDSLYQGISEGVARHGLVLTDVILSREALLNVNSVITVLSQHQPQAFIVNLHFHIPKPLIFLMTSLSIPRAWINVKRDHLCVRPDDFEATRSLVHHLVGLGHQRIAFVNHHNFFWPGNHIHYSLFDRSDGYTQGMKEAGLAPHVAWIESVTRAADVEALINGPIRPTAVILYTPDFELIREIRACGRRIPEDVSVAMIDNLDSRQSFEGLAMTAMRIDWHGLGSQVIAMIVDQHGSFTPMPSRVVPLVFDPGRSCVPPPPTPGA